MSEALKYGNYQQETVSNTALLPKTEIIKKLEFEKEKSKQSKYLQELSGKTEQANFEIWFENNIDEIFFQENKIDIPKNFKNYYDDYENCIEKISTKLQDLKTKLESSNNQINLNGQTFDEIIKNTGNTLQNILFNETLSSDIKDKFLTDFNNLFQKLENVSPTDILTTKSTRTILSLGTVGIEDDNKILSMLVGKNFTQELEKKENVIQTCFIDEKDSDGYHLETKKNFESKLQELDKKYGIDITKILKVGLEKNETNQSIGVGLLYYITDGGKIFPEHGETVYDYYSGLIKDSEKLNFKNDYKLNGFNVEDIFNDYYLTYCNFANKDKAIKQTTLDIQDKGFIENIESKFETEKIDTDIKNIDEKELEKLTPQELLMIINYALVSFLPGEEIAELITRRDYDGKEHNAVDIGLNVISGSATLVPVIGVYLGKLVKAGKIAESMKLVGKAIEILSKQDKIKELVKTEEVKEKLINFLEKLKTFGIAGADKLFKTLNNENGYITLDLLIPKVLQKKLGKEGFEEVMKNIGDIDIKAVYKLEGKNIFEVRDCIKNQEKLIENIKLKYFFENGEKLVLGIANDRINEFVRDRLTNIVNMVDYTVNGIKNGKLSEGDIKNLEYLQGRLKGVIDSIMEQVIELKEIGFVLNNENLDYVYNLLNLLK